MSFNPYSPPQDYPPDPYGGGGGSRVDGVQPWSAGDVFQEALDISKRHWVPLVFGLLFANLLGSIPGWVGNAIGRDPHERFTLIGSLGSILGYFVQIFFTAGSMRLALRAARGGAPEISQIFSGGSAYFRLLLTSILTSLVVLLGFLCLIVPGIILALGLSLAPYYAVDAEMGPIEAMKASWKSMDGYKGAMFLYGLIAFAITILGLLACCVGVLFSQAIVMVGLAVIYTRASGRMTSPDDAPMGWGGGGGGYGPGPVPPPGGGWGAT